MISSQIWILIEPGEVIYVVVSKRGHAPPIIELTTWNETIKPKSHSIDSFVFSQVLSFMSPHTRKLM